MTMTRYQMAHQTPAPLVKGAPVLDQRDRSGACSQDELKIKRIRKPDGVVLALGVVSPGKHC